MAHQQDRLEQLFEAALALDTAERAAFLDKVCDHDPEVRQMVEELLAEDARAGSFLQNPAFGFLNPGMAIQYSAERLQPGQTLIDRFVVARFIARGGMGEVYEVEDRFLQGARVALKTILPHISEDPVLRQRFEREVLVAREVMHPNLCPIYEIFHCEEPPPGFLFLTMKLLPGQTLAARLQGSVPIPSKEGLVILKQMAAGIVAIHDAGIVHRDIKPNNVILDGAGAHVRLWITDFGLARAFESESTITAKGMVAGTPGYIAPELLQGHPPSQATDLFAFGVVLHEIFTGRKPLMGADNAPVLVSPHLGASGAPSNCVQLIRGCLDIDPKRRCDAFEIALHELNLKRRVRKPWTRRQFLGTAAAAVCAVGGTAWWDREQIENWLHPLPGKRFIALLNWPKTADSQIAPMLTGALSAIKNELARVEAFDRNLFVITPEDAQQDVSAAVHLKEVCDPLGANLVLAASGSSRASRFRLVLRLLDPISGRSIREKDVTCALDQITSLPGKAVQAAASLLNLNRYLRDGAPIMPGTQSTAAFTAFQQAETLKNQVNDTGLDAAIEKYKEAIELDPRYAIAHAKLSIAYGRYYAIRRDPAALDLARGNGLHALALNPNLVESHLAMAAVLEQTGDEQGALKEIAKALKLDPSNPRTLVWQAQLYTRLNRLAEAKETFNRVLQERPNYWLAYNELGFALHKEGKYQDAIHAFRTASLAAPGSSMALSNLGEEYLQIGGFADATESLKKSLALDPASDQAASGISLALRYQGKNEEALPFALKAVELNPAEDTNWLELGDCYSSLRNQQGEAKAAYLRAAQEAERHLGTDSSDGPAWMLLALYQVKSGTAKNPLALIQRAEQLGAGDVDSQIYKARILELLGRRDEALATLATCFRRGANAFQVAPFPDLRSLREDPRYREMVHSPSARGEANQLPRQENS